MSDPVTRRYRYAVLSTYRYPSFRIVSKELYDVVIFCSVPCMPQGYHSCALVAKNAHFLYGHRFLRQIRMAPFRLPACGNLEKFVAPNANNVPRALIKLAIPQNSDLKQKGTGNRPLALQATPPSYHSSGRKRLSPLPRTDDEGKTCSEQLKKYLAVSWQYPSFVMVLKNLSCIS